jgi:hypothetical protein
MSYEMILGAPFFRKYNTILDFQRKQLRIPPFSVPIYETVEAARTSIVSPKWVDAEIFHMEIITTVADERNMNISVRASFLPGICDEQIIWPYSGASIASIFQITTWNQILRTYSMST